MLFERGPGATLKRAAVAGHVLRGDGATAVSGAPVVAYYRNGSQPNVFCGDPERVRECALAAGTTDANHHSWLGAGYRMIADLSDPAAGLWAIEVGGASGHPGSPHYTDQVAPWLAGAYHYTPLAAEPKEPGAVLVLEPLP